MKIARCLLFVVALCDAACGTTLNYIETRPPPGKLYVRKPEQVEVFMTSRPNRPFVEVGMLESRQGSLSRDDADTVVAKMRQFAGERGCHALVIFASNDATETSGSQGYTSSRSLKGYRGACLVYTVPRAAPGGAARAACRQQLHPQRDPALLRPRRLSRWPAL